MADTQITRLARATMAIGSVHPIFCLRQTAGMAPYVRSTKCLDLFLRIKEGEFLDFDGVLIFDRDDITKPVSLDVRFVFEGAHPLGPFLEDFKGVHYVGFRARTKLLRSDFGMGTAMPLVSDRIAIEIVAEMRRRD